MNFDEFEYLRYRKRDIGSAAILHHHHHELTEQTTALRLRTGIWQQVDGQHGYGEAVQQNFLHLYGSLGLLSRWIYWPMILQISWQINFYVEFRCLGLLSKFLSE